MLKRILYHLARYIAALIMLQTLYFKFSGHEESVYIFSMVGMEPWGRIGIGILELLASTLLVIPPTSWIGSLLTTGLMSGAVFMHLTRLGIDINGDGGYLFYLALIVFVCALILVVMERKKILDKTKGLFGF